MIKPHKTLFLLFYTFAFLGLCLLLPNKITLGQNFSLKVPKITAVFDFSKPEYADISTIQDDFEPLPIIKKDSIAPDSNANKKPVKKYVPDSLRLNPELAIQYSNSKADTLLYGFFRQLRKLEAGDQDLLRVVHFGDSQLEGDRITAFLRDKFQQTFGGCGVGMANIVDKLNSKSSIVQKTSSPWKQYPLYGYQYRKAHGSYYGLLGDYYKFDLAGEEPTWTKASVNYFKSPYGTPNQQKVEHLKILYRNPEAPFELSVNAPGQEALKVKIEQSEKLGIYKFPLESPFERVEVGFASGTASPEVYGVALDCNSGITFDNVPLRGSSGIEFTRVNKEHLRQQFERLNVKLLILQFGVNIVPNPQTSYGWYENMFLQQLKFLKSLSPNLSILVVGVSDMSYNNGEGYESYPNIEKIRNAQKNAAFKAGCAFWDLYEAMGGHNSMPSWVFAKPQALANKDFTHFTAKGALIVSEMLYKAILSEYDEFNAVLY